MTLGSEGASTVRFSTGNLPARDRLSFWHDYFTREVVRCEVEPLSDLPFEAEATLLDWPGLRAMWSHVSSPATYRRKPHMIAEGDDAFALVVKQSGHFTMSQRGAEVLLGAGEAVGVLHADPAAMTNAPVDYFALIVPRSALAPFVADIEGAAMRRIPQNNEALQLLVKYVGILHEPNPASPELRQLAVNHIVDLVALALGANRDGSAMANARGVRTARLRAIKADILENLGNPALTVNSIALRQRVTPRYVHMLFELEGVTFSEFVLGQRLKRAYRLLTNPCHAGSTIATIAFEVGFGDLSYFNRAFRRRFGATPSDLRQRPV